MTDFKYDLGSEQFSLVDARLGTDDGEAWFASLEEVEDGSLSSLRRAAIRAGDNYGKVCLGVTCTPDEEFILSLSTSDVSAENYNADYAPQGPTIGVLPDGRIVLAVVSTVDPDNAAADDDLVQLLTPLLQRSGARPLYARSYLAGDASYCEVRAEVVRRGLTVGDVVALGKDVDRLVEALGSRSLELASVLELLSAKRPDLLVGLPEGDWLEAKSQGYDLSADFGRIELAQDVARFANGFEDAVLVIGLKTRKIAGEDTIIKLTGSLTPFDAGRHHKAIDARVFPPIQGLRVTAFTSLSTPELHYLYVYVPRQPEEAKPFLVHGAIVSGKVEGAFISLVQRRGEGSIPATPAAIHATMAAGRALLRRGELPAPRRSGS